MAQIKETEELVVGLLDLAIFLKSRLKDGVDVGDAVALFQKLVGDAEFKAKMEAAFKGVNQVQGEVTDLDLNETIRLIQVIAAKVPEFLAA